MKELINSVLDQIKKDMDNGDSTAITELLMSCPLENLKAFLPEE